MAYVKQSWSNEILTNPDVRFTIKQDDGTVINDDIDIVMKTPVETQGTPVTAERMLHIEQGIYDATKDFETSAANIKPAGTASVGVLDTVARADHVHPERIWNLVWIGTATSGTTLTSTFVFPSVNYWEVICMFGLGYDFYSASSVINVAPSVTINTFAPLSHDLTLYALKLAIATDASRAITSIVPTFTGGSNLRRIFVRKSEVT